MKIIPFSEGCGATIADVQLASISDPEFNEMRQALLQHGVVFFRNQELSQQDHLDFAHKIGAIKINPFFPPLGEYPEIAIVSKSEKQEMNIGGGWHTDHSYEEAPALGSILVARELPVSGGDTHFANLAAVYESFSDGFKSMLKGLRAIHSSEHIYGEGGYYSSTDQAEHLNGMGSVGRATHRVVINHPESGRETLYVNPAHTIGIEGWNTEESKALLEYLFEHAVQDQFICHFNWEPGSIAFWDNRCTWHFAQNDYAGQARLMHRITIEGSVLV